MDMQLEHQVRLALEQNPRISNPKDIAISADYHTVTLRGTVPSFKQRRVAVEAVRNIRGVQYVADELEVALLADNRADDELRGVALQTLLWDADVPQRIDVTVRNGWVTLRGEVRHQFQSDAAFEDVARLEGVGGITNEIRVVTAV